MSNKPTSISKLYVSMVYNQHTNFLKQDHSNINKPYKINMRKYNIPNASCWTTSLTFLIINLSYHLQIYMDGLKPIIPYKILCCDVWIEFILVCCDKQTFQSGSIILLVIIVDERFIICQPFNNKQNNNLCVTWKIIQENFFYLINRHL